MPRRSCRHCFRIALVGLGLIVAGCRTSSPRLAVNNTEPGAVSPADAEDDAPEADIRQVNLEQAKLKDLEVQHGGAATGAGGSSLLGGLFKRFREPQRIPLPRTDLNSETPLESLPGADPSSF